MKQVPSESAGANARTKSPVDRERVRAQMRAWQDRVLDLTKSNPLIGLNRSRVTKLRVAAPDAATLFSRVVLDETTLRLPLVRKRPAAEGSERNLFESEAEPELIVDRGDITFDAKPLDLLRGLKRIYDNARTTVEERGVTTLHLTFGALHWRDELFGESISPLWMVPCELESKGPNAPLRLRISDEESQLNPALEYCLRERHKVRLPELPDEPDGKSLGRLLRQVGQVVQERRWETTEEIWLSTFSFESLVIYRDLQALTEAATDHSVIATLARATPSVGGSEALPGDLDNLPVSPASPIPVLSTDSSQLEALTVAAGGRHVVVHGPPGTGKSQTIANLIADALSRDRKVLFVSAKMAALNVVHDRLKELGLQRFCLEAHSTKAGKQKIVDELRRTLEHDGVGDSSALERELQSLVRVRDQLNAYAKDLHKRIEPFGATVYRVNGRLARLDAAPDVRCQLPWPNPLSVSRDDFQERVQALEDLASSATTFDKRANHPWRGFATAEHFGVTEQEAVEAALREVNGGLAPVASAAAQLECLAIGAADFSLREWQSLREVVKALVTLPELPTDWWQQSGDELAKMTDLFREASRRRTEIDGLRVELRELTVKTPPDLVTLLAHVRDRFGSWHAPLRRSYWNWRKDVRHVLRTNVKFSRRHCRAILEKAERAVALKKWFEANATAINRYAGHTDSVSPTKLAETAHQFAVAASWQRGLADIGRKPAAVLTISKEARASITRLLAVLAIDGASASNAIQKLDHWWPKGFIDHLQVGVAPLPRVVERIGLLLSSLDRAREWVRLLRIIERCAALGLTPFVDAIGGISASDAPKAFEKRFCRLWVSAVLEQHPSLADFNQAKGTDLLDKHRTLDARVRNLAIARTQAVASSAATRVRSARDISDSEVGVLRYELQKRKRVKPLRKLFGEIPNVLQALKPCLLMSPISVSTYLNAKAIRFDLVVFDEASQLPTAEAVPSILRAQQVVVAGDANQLPPTSFFETSIIGDDEDEEDDTTKALTPLESLLDDCVAVVPLFREAYLRWHYRSRDERLIKFSNHYFYNNRLLTFPASAPASAGQGVRFIHVPDGIYDRGRSRTNRREARTVARLAVEHFTHFPDRSLGIVALGLSQREAIEDAISEELSTRPDLVPYFDPSREEAVFVKSLENVQGDERDTMLISVGYGHDERGGLSMNFGPINTDGGWRRLNVLVTRAKWECILVSSLRGSELAAVNPNNRGAVALRDFLEFAARNGELPVQPTTITEGETNDFEDAVRATLLDRGFEVDAQVGASQYRIDLAVRDRRDRTRYVLGIECDGAGYHSSRTARDRDLVRQQVLHGMGWRIHRVWSTEWFYERKQAIDGVLRSIEQAESRPITDGVLARASDKRERISTFERPSKEPVVERKYEAGVAYELYRPPHRLDRDHLLQKTYTEVLARTIGELVAVEGPIHHDFMVERLKDLHKVERAGSNIQANIKSALRQAARRQVVEHETRSPFYRAPTRPLQRFRICANGVTRSIEHIAPEELAMAVLHLVEDQFGLVEERTPSAVARLFGVERLWSESADSIRSVIDDLVSKGALRRSGMQLYLA